MTAEPCADPLSEAAVRFSRLDSYRVTLRAVAGDGTRQHIRYAWRRPGWIRMDFVEPHAGVVMIHDPDAGRVRVSPFGAGHLPQFNLAPDNALIRSPNGHTVDQSDVGALLANLVRLRAVGRMSDPVTTDVGGLPATLVEIDGAAGQAVDGVHRYQVWLARDTLFPLKVQSFDAGHALIESVDMSDAELDIAFPPDFFSP